MRKIFWFSILTLAVIAIVVILRPERISNKTVLNYETVSVTVFPIFDIAQNVAGDAVKVELILPPGASPHTFEPSPSTIATLETSSVVYAVGHGLDEWINDLSMTPMVTVDREIVVREEANEDEHGQTDPHYWLTIENAKRISQTIASDLSERFPKSATVIDDNLRSYLLKLDATDQEIRDTLSTLNNRSIVTFHDAWYYFANGYDLSIIGTYEPTAGREPTAQYLARLITGLKTAGTRTIFSEPQFGKANLEAFANDNELSIIELDPVGGENGRESYTELMLFNAQTIAQNN